jgi:hypothetical protein
MRTPPGPPPLRRRRAPIGKYPKEPVLRKSIELAEREILTLVYM